MSLLLDVFQVSISVDEEFLRSKRTTGAIFDTTDHRRIVGQIIFSVDKIPSSFLENQISGLKRPLSTNLTPKLSLKAPRMSASQIRHGPQSVDVGSALKSLNLVPVISNDLQCTLCPYKATQKSNLKTHYQLKHLGGGGLAVLCSVCQQKFATKSSCKKHMITVHQLSSQDASKLLN